MKRNKLNNKVAIIMGSQSDHSIMKECAKILKTLKIKYQISIVSAHRTPKRMFEFAESASKNGFGVIVAGAGGSAHLPGMVASLSSLPVIGVPIETKKLKGLDSLLSIVQMPRGCPVATMAINGSMNAGLLAASIIGNFDEKIKSNLEKWKRLQTKSIKKNLNSMTISTLGIIGSGQLGSLLCQAAKKLNIKTIVISDDENGPAQNYSGEFIYSQYDNKEKIKEFVSKVDIITYEFENIPINILNEIDKEKKVLPKPEINRIIQNRKLEKTFVNDLGIKTTDWAFIKQAADIEKNKNLLPGILKSNTLGYDGHGQYVLNSLDDVKKNWCFTADYILEKKVNLKKEISVVITRYLNGETYIYEPIENIHKDQILNHSKIPADINKEIFVKAQSNAKLISEKLDYVGTMCVEYFIDQDDNLLVNEIAPRVHNSGHLTINAFSISQFSGHVAAVCNLGVKKVEKISNAEMFNVLGKDIETYRSKTFSKNEFFYDYGKKSIKDKRKMGHLTVLKK